MILIDGKIGLIKMFTISQVLHLYSSCSAYELWTPLAVKRNLNCSLNTRLLFSFKESIGLKKTSSHVWASRSEKP